MRPDLPQDLRRFILTSIPSVPYLEALLLLRGESQRSWSAAEAARRLYLPEQRATELLAGLVGAGIARQESLGYRYSPATEELAAILDQLATHYSADLVGISDLIHSRVDKKAQQFADAFRIRKDS